MPAAKLLGSVVWQQTVVLFVLMLKSSLEMQVYKNSRDRTDKCMGNRVDQFGICKLWLSAIKLSFQEFMKVVELEFTEYLHESFMFRFGIRIDI